MYRKGGLARLCGLSVAFLWSARAWDIKRQEGEGKKRTRPICSPPFSVRHTYKQAHTHIRSLAAVALRPQGKRLGRRPRDDLACFPRKKTDQRLTLSAGCTARNMGLRSAALQDRGRRGRAFWVQELLGHRLVCPPNGAVLRKLAGCSAAVVGRRCCRFLRSLWYRSLKIFP